MCGITGFLRVASPGKTTRLDSPETTLRRMNASLFHRGPDDEGYLTRDPVYLAMRRLKIIDLATGRQPIFNEDGTIGIVYNGEIYNYLELKKELESKGHRFRTISDTEVLVHLYEEEGEAFPRRLRGMFAFALWDDQTRQLVLGRDHFGIKPLYWGLFNGFLLFGSEIKAVRQHEAFRRELDWAALDDYLTLMFIPTPQSVYRGLFKLEPGHLLIVNEDGRWRKRCFWQPASFVGRIGYGNGHLKQALAALDEKISECVRLALRSDVPLGVFLSGGIDSSLVSFYAKQHAAETRTFNVYFREESFSERAESRQIAAHLKTDHAEILMEMPSDLPDFAAKTLACFDEPFGDPSALPTYLLCAAARQHVTVCLSGDGGDELFGGYPTFMATAILPYWRRLPSVLRQQVLPILSRWLPVQLERVSWDYKVKRFIETTALHEDLIQAHFAWRGAFQWNERPHIYTDEFWSAVEKRAPYASVAGCFNETKQAPLMDQLFYADLRTYLLDAYLVKVDRMSMAHSLEVRPPLLDPELAALAFSIDHRYKVRGFKTKWILRRLMQGRLPRRILNLGKMGFTPPLGRWFFDRRFNDFFRDMVLSNSFRSLGVLNSALSMRILEEHLQRAADHSRRLWVILGLALFAQRHNAEG